MTVERTVATVRKILHKQQIFKNKIRDIMQPLLEKFGIIIPLHSRKGCLKTVDYFFEDLQYINSKDFTGITQRIALVMIIDNSQGIISHEAVSEKKISDMSNEFKQFFKQYQIPTCDVSKEVYQGYVDLKLGGLQFDGLRFLSDVLTPFFRLDTLFLKQLVSLRLMHSIDSWIIMAGNGIDASFLLSSIRTHERLPLSENTIHCGNNNLEIYCRLPQVGRNSIESKLIEEKREYRHLTSRLRGWRDSNKECTVQYKGARTAVSTNNSFSKRLIKQKSKKPIF